MEALRRALLAESAETPHYHEALGPGLEQLRSLDLTSAPPPSAELTCRFAAKAVPVMALHAVGVLNWNSSRWDDVELARETVDRWCGEVASLARSGCGGLRRDDPLWQAHCGELEDDGFDAPPTVAQRWAAIERARKSCEERSALQERCGANEAASDEDARRLARLLRNEVEAFYSGGYGTYAAGGTDADPYTTAEMHVLWLQELQSGEPSPASRVD